MGGLSVRCETPGCLAQYDGGNGTTKPGPYRPQGYHFSEKARILKDVGTLGWIHLKEKNIDYCPQCANTIYERMRTTLMKQQNRSIEEDNMTEQVTAHILNDSPMGVIKIEALGEGPFGGHNHYLVTGFDKTKNPHYSDRDADMAHHRAQTDIYFQHGNPVPDGPNGITIEVLLAIAAHRLEGFQKGKFANEHNVVALDKIYGALDALKTRELSYLKPDSAPDASKTMHFPNKELQYSVNTLREFMHLFSKDTLDKMELCHFSEELVDQMEAEVGAMDVSEIIKTELMAAIQRCAGKSLISITDTSEQELPERVVMADPGVLNNAAYWSEFSHRPIKAHDATIEVTIVTDARQSGTDVLAQNIRRTLIDGGYKRVAQYARIEEGGPLDPRPTHGTDAQELVRMYGQESADKIIDNLKNVNIKIVTDIVASKQRTRQ